MSPNPFLGPQPYRSEDRNRFLGRTEAIQQLSNRILASPCVTLFGPSGSGKSSLLQAGVLPHLKDTRDCRVVQIEGWLLKEETPLERLVQALIRQLDLQSQEKTEPVKWVTQALDLAEQQSDRPLLICLDQFEQLLQPGVDTTGRGELLKALQALTCHPMPGLQLIISLREDYLGRFRDWARGKRELLDQSFRLGPLKVREMVEIACQLAECGSPPQHWDPQALTQLMYQVRDSAYQPTPDAEVQTAFAQIVCRSLWEKEGQMQAAQAESLLQHYLEKTLRDLGRLEGPAGNFLEKHLITVDGSRTLLMQKDARAALFSLTDTDVNKILTHLEEAAVLRAEAHLDSRYLELGHDWLARKLFDRREAKDIQEKEQALRQQELQARQQRDEAQARFERERKLKRWFGYATAICLILVVVITSLAILIFRQAQEARALTVMAGAHEQVALHSMDVASKLLLEVKDPEQARGWKQLAFDVLVSPAQTVTMHCQTKSATAAVFSPDGKSIAVACEDGNVRIWNSNGQGRPIELQRHEHSVTSVVFSPDGQRVVTSSKDGMARVWQTMDGKLLNTLQHGETIWSATFSPNGERIVTASSDKTARVWLVDGTSTSIVLPHEDIVTSAVFSANGESIVTSSWDGTARVWRSNGEPLGMPMKHGFTVWSAAFSPDGKSIVTASSDKTARVWSTDGTSTPVILQHEGIVTSAAFSSDGKRIVTASSDKTARVWSADGTSAPLVLRGHQASVYSAFFDPKDEHIVTASADGMARIWKADGSGLIRSEQRPEGTNLLPVQKGRFIARITKGDPNTVQVNRSDDTGESIFLQGHTSHINGIRFDSTQQSIVTASADKTARVWSTETGQLIATLSGHGRGVTSAVFSTNGQRIVTASEDGTTRVWNAATGKELLSWGGHDTNASIWSAAFSPDDQRIVTAASDGTARVWHIVDGRALLLVVLRGDDTQVTSANFSSDGRFIHTMTQTGRERIWPMTISEIQQLLRQLNPDCLSPEIRYIYLAEEETQARERYMQCERTAERPFLQFPPQDMRR